MRDIPNRHEVPPHWHRRLRENSNSTWLGIVALVLLLLATLVASLRVARNAQPIRPGTGGPPELLW